MVNPQLKIPLGIILVDILGTLAAGIGVADAVAGIKLVPQEYRFPYYNWILTGIGFLLISFHSIYMVRMYRWQSSPDARVLRSKDNNNEPTRKR